MTIINGKTKLLGVIGDPIGHTLSPLMHNAAIDALGLNYVYLPLPIAPENLVLWMALPESVMVP
jgi:shikimate dehydrogenase